MPIVTEEEAVTALRAAGCVFAEDEAAMIIKASTSADAVAAMVRRRSLGEPLEQVVGHADFAGVRVHLVPGVFVPRVRSEFLVREAVRRTPENAVVVDVCCGSGALGLAVKRQKPNTTLYAADVDPVAAACARENLRNKGEVYQGNLFNPLPEHIKADVILANVPYVATRHIALLPAEARDHEPRTALDGGDDGLDLFRAVLAAAPDRLRPGGVLLSEITEAQVEAAITAVRAAGLSPGIVTDDDLEATVVLAVR